MSRLFSAAAAVALTLALTLGVTPAAPTAAEAASCSGVWVVVGSSARCATSHSTA